MANYQLKSSIHEEANATDKQSGLEAEKDTEMHSLKYRSKRIGTWTLRKEFLYVVLQKNGMGWRIGTENCERMR